MKTGVSWRGAGLLLALCGMSSLGDATQHETTQPDSFAFTQNEYVVGENATNAIITVMFQPGSRGSTGGGVGYTTEDATAIAGEDYVHVEGGLVFAWPSAPRSFKVPIIWDDVDEGDQTIRLRLLGQSYRPTAILRITNVPPPQRLRLERVRPGLVTISWPGNHGGCIIEQSTNLLPGHWTALTNSPATVSGRFVITNDSSGAATFYRLRKP